jgi:hypothetical protein
VYNPSKFSMDKDLNLRRLNPFKPDINIVRHNFKNQSQQTDLRKHFPGETQTPDSFRIRYRTWSIRWIQLWRVVEGIYNCGY